MIIAQAIIDIFLSYKLSDIITMYNTVDQTYKNYTFSCHLTKSQLIAVPLEISFTTFLPNSSS